MKAQQIRCLVCGFTAMLIFEKTQKIVSLEAMWYCPHCGSEDTENMAGIQGIKRLKDSLITAYKEAFRHYYENKGLSQESFYEGMCCGLETALREIGVDNEDIAQLQEAVKEEAADAYAERKFYEEHGYYPDEEVNK